MSKQLELFPEMLWVEYEYNGKTYRRFTGGKITSYRKRVEQQMKLNRFIDEYNKKTI